jgi:hypothetical protein
MGCSSQAVQNSDDVLKMLIGPTVIGAIPLIYGIRLYRSGSGFGYISIGLGALIIGLPAVILLNTGSGISCLGQTPDDVE